MFLPQSLDTVLEILDTSSASILVGLKRDEQAAHKAIARLKNDEVRHAYGLFCGTVLPAMGRRHPERAEGFLKFIKDPNKPIPATPWAIIADQLLGSSMLREKLQGMERQSIDIWQKWNVGETEIAIQALEELPVGGTQTYQLICAHLRTARREAVSDCLMPLQMLPLLLLVTLLLAETPNCKTEYEKWLQILISRHKGRPNPFGCFMEHCREISKTDKKIDFLEHIFPDWQASSAQKEYQDYIRGTKTPALKFALSIATNAGQGLTESDTDGLKLLAVLSLFLQKGLAKTDRLNSQVSGLSANLMVSDLERIGAGLFNPARI